MFLGPLSYPIISDQYSVQYKLGGGAWTPAPVHISYYGATLASPSNSASGYGPGTSFSFVSIPVPASTAVQLQVTKLSSNFLPSDNVSIRPHTKPVVEACGFKLSDFRSKSWEEFAGPDAPKLDLKA